MTSPEKRKGNAFETEIVDLAKQSDMYAKRAWGSNGESLGLHAEVDCVVEHRKIQCKRRKGLAKDMIPGPEVDVVACRMDGGEPLIVCKYVDWLDLIKAADMLKGVQDDISIAYEHLQLGEDVMAGKILEENIK